MILYHGTNCSIDKIDKQLMELITQDIIAKFSQDTGRSIADAMVIFYNSEFFEKLYDAETGLYLEGSDYLYGIFSDEIKQGKLVQNEI